MLKSKLIALMLVAVIGISLIVTGCGQSKPEVPTVPEAPKVEDDPRANWPKEVVISLIPTDDEDALATRWEDFRLTIEKQMGVPVKLFIGTDYTASIEAMRNGFVHVGYYGPFAYVLAHERANAEAFCVVLRNKATGIASYQALFLGLEGSGVNSIADLKGKTIGWVDPTSTSGHLFPKAYLIDKLGLSYESVDSYFSNVVFTGGHEASFIAVLNGNLDSAPITSNNYKRYMDAFKDHPNIGKMKVIDQTDPIPTSAFTYHADLPDSFKEAIKDAFLSIEETPEVEDSIFIPVEDGAYDVIRMTVTALGMDPADLM